MIHQSTKPNSK